MIDPLDETIARMKQRNRQDFIIYVVEPALLVAFVVLVSFIKEWVWLK